MRYVHGIETSVFIRPLFLSTELGLTSSSFLFVEKERWPAFATSANEKTSCSLLMPAEAEAEWGGGGEYFPFVFVVRCGRTGSLIYGVSRVHITNRIKTIRLERLTGFRHARRRDFHAEISAEKLN